MVSRSVSRAEQDAPSWLKQVYSAKQQRTIDLVKMSVDALLEAKQPVSLSTIVAKSKELDPEGRGISVSAIHRNEAANAHYIKHRSHKEPQSRRSTTTTQVPTSSLRIKPDRNINQARQRYLKLSKEELVSRLLMVEQTFAEKEERWDEFNDDQLTQRLRAEKGEIQNELDEEVEDSQFPLVKINQLRIRNKELNAQLMGVASLESENEQLRKQNQRLFNRITQLEADERSTAAKKFSRARAESANQTETLKKMSRVDES